MERENEDNYVEEVSCSNCSFHGEVKIEKGNRLGDEDCPRCGVKSLRKSLRGTVKKELDNILG